MLPIESDGSRWYCMVGCSRRNCRHEQLCQVADHRKIICVAAAALNAGSRCSFTTSKLRFFASVRLASAASKTLLNGLEDYPDSLVALRLNGCPCVFPQLDNTV